MKERVRRKGFGLSGSLLAVSAFVLLWSLEILPEGYWWQFFLSWPIWLAAAVANLLLSRLHVWAGSLAALVLMAGALFGAWWVAEGGDAPPVLPATTEAISMPLNGVQTAQVTLTTSGGGLALAGGAPPGQLLVGDFEGMALPAAEYSVRMSSLGTRKTLDITLLGSWEIPFPPHRPISTGRWKLHHASGVPTDLQVDGSATTLDLDLQGLTVRILQVEAGAADIAVVMPGNAGRTDGSFKIGAASLDIEIPAGVAARIELVGGLSRVDIDTARFPSQGGGRYASPDFETATNRVTISIDADAGDIAIR